MNRLLEFEQGIRRDIASCREEIAFWDDLVGRKVCPAEFAASYIDREKRILKIKTDVLVFASPKLVNRSAGDVGPTN